MQILYTGQQASRNMAGIYVSLPTGRVVDYGWALPCLKPTLCHHNSGTWCPTGTFVPQQDLVVGPFSGGTDQTGWS